MTIYQQSLILGFMSSPTNTTTTQTESERLDAEWLEATGETYTAMQARVAAEIAADGYDVEAYL